MEWVLLALCSTVAAALIGVARRHEDDAVADEGDVLALERERLLGELRELDDDAASGRISAGERLAGRRALAPRLRAVTEALRETGLDARGGG